jgi:hypothetical protein
VALSDVQHVDQLLTYLMAKHRESTPCFRKRSGERDLACTLLTYLEEDGE